MIRVQIIENGEVTEEEDFDGFIGVGFNSEEDYEPGLLERLLGGTRGVSMAVGYLSAEDFIAARAVVDATVTESLEEMGIEDSDIESMLMKDDWGE